MRSIHHSPSAYPLHYIVLVGHIVKHSNGKQHTKARNCHIVCLAQQINIWWIIALKATIKIIIEEEFICDGKTFLLYKWRLNSYCPFKCLLPNVQFWILNADHYYCYLPGKWIQNSKSVWLKASMRRSANIM